MGKILVLLSIFVILSCDTGLAPAGSGFDEPGISGTITFSGTWPEGVSRTHIVIFKDSLNSPGDFNALNLRYVSPEIPYGSNEFEYSTHDESILENIQAGEYAYLAVAQSSTLLLSLNRSDWNVVGLWAKSDGDPASIFVPAGTYLKDININCDFNTPPVQPPGGINE